MENPKAEGISCFYSCISELLWVGNWQLRAGSFMYSPYWPGTEKKLPDSKAESKLRERYGRERVSWDREPGGIGRKGLPLQLGVPGQGN